MGDRRDTMQTHLGAMNNSPEERYRAARTIARLSMGNDGEDAKETCRIMLEACGLLDPSLAPSRQ